MESGADGEDADGGDADGPETQMQQCANTFERWTTLVLPAPPAGELGSMGCQQHFFP